MPFSQQRVKLRKTQCEHIFSALPSNADIHHGCRKVSEGPKHKGAALQPAAREQELRGRWPVERAAIAGWQVNTINQRSVGVQNMIARGSASSCGRHIIGRTDNAMIKIPLTKAPTSLLECAVYISASQEIDSRHVAGHRSID
jgi:hypothetical protein